MADSRPTGSCHNLIFTVILRRSKCDNKFGFRQESINGSVFIWFILDESPAQAAGLKFGDQLLAINDSPVAGHSTQEIIQICQSLEQMKLTIRSGRYHEHKFHLSRRNLRGSFGFHQSFGKIVSIERDSSAARKGLLIKYNILQVNDRTVIGLDDGEICELIDKCGNNMTLTIVPSQPFGQLLGLAYISRKIPDQVTRVHKMYE